MNTAAYRPEQLSFWPFLSATGAGIIAAYGAGGKTSSLMRLAREAVAAGKKVVLTTTTHIYPPERIGLVLEKSWKEQEKALRLQLARKDVAVLASGLLPEGKLSGIEPVLLERLRDAFPETVFLVEADGAAGRSLKGYAPYEPVIPPSSALILPLLGLSALGLPAGPETVHRPEFLLPVLGLSPGETLAATHLVRAMLYLIRHGQEQAPQAKVVPLFNQADRVAPLETETLRSIGAGLRDCAPVKSFIWAALHEEPPLRFIMERNAGAACFAAPVCAVVLAAGLAERMGCDKLALSYRGKTVLEHTVERVSAAGIREVVVVVRPGSPWRKKFASRPGVRVVQNPRFREGIASSLQTGLAAVAANTQAVLFALGDQPLIPPAIYRDIVATYQNRLAPVVYPLYCGRRGNPALFDRRTWPQLFQLQGDAGGSQIFPRLGPADVAAVELGDPAVCADLDSPEDYRRLLEE